MKVSPEEIDQLVEISETNGATCEMIGRDTDNEKSIKDGVDHSWTEEGTL